MKKLLVEKVPEGVRVTITFDPAKMPLVVVLTPAQIEMLALALRQAVRSDDFRFEYQP